MRLLKKSLLNIVIITTLTAGQSCWGSSQAALSVNAEAEKQRDVDSNALTVLKALAKSNRVTIILEGEGTTEYAPPPENQGLMQETKEKYGATNAILSLLAQAGLEGKRSGNIIIGRRNFGRSEDIPDLTLAQCLFCLENCKRILAHFQPGHQEAPIDDFTNMLLHKVVDSLTSDQIVAMKTTDLSISSLSQDQQNALRDLSLNTYVDGPSNSINSAIEFLRFMLKKDTKIRFRSKNSSSLGIIVSRPKTVFGDPFMPFARRRSERKLAHSQLPELLPLHEESATIGTIVQQLRTKNPALRIEADPAVADIPVVVIEGAETTAEETIRAIAVACGLRVVLENGTMVVKPQSVFTPDQIADLPKAIYSALPDSLIRFASLTPSEIETGADKVNEGSVKRPSSASVERFSEVADRMNVTAVSRLASSVKPRLKERPAMSLLTSELTPRERRLAATAIMAQVMEAFKTVGSENQPSYVTNFNSASLKGGKYPARRGGMEFRFALQIPDESGHPSPWIVYMMPEKSEK